MSAYRADSDEIEFHLATLMVDLRALSSMTSSMTSETWTAGVLPLIAHAAGVCYAIASIVDEKYQQIAKDLATAIASIPVPDKSPDKTVSGQERAWQSISDKHGELARALDADELQPWVLGKGGMVRWAKAPPDA